MFSVGISQPSSAYVSSAGLSPSSLNGVIFTDSISNISVSKLGIPAHSFGNQTPIQNLPALFGT